MVLPYLHDDMLLFLAKYYLSERDNLDLAISGASERFTILYGINRYSRLHILIFLDSPLQIQF